MTDTSPSSESVARSIIALVQLRIAVDTKEQPLLLEKITSLQTRNLKLLRAFGATPSTMELKRRAVVATMIQYQWTVLQTHDVVRAAGPKDLQHPCESELGALLTRAVNESDPFSADGRSPVCPNDKYHWKYWRDNVDALVHLLVTLRQLRKTVEDSGDLPVESNEIQLADLLRTKLERARKLSWRLPLASQARRSPALISPQTSVRAAKIAFDNQRKYIHEIQRLEDNEPQLLVDLLTDFLAVSKQLWAKIMDALDALQSTVKFSVVNEIRLVYFKKSVENWDEAEDSAPPGDFWLHKASLGRLVGKKWRYEPQRRKRVMSY